MTQRGRGVESKAKGDRTMTQEHEAVHINTHTRTRKDTHMRPLAKACYFRQIPKKGDVLDEKEREFHFNSNESLNYVTPLHSHVVTILPTSSTCP